MLKFFNMSKTVYFYIVFVLGFLSYYFFDLFCFKPIQNYSKEIFPSKAFAHIIAYSISLIPLIITLKILFPQKKLVNLLSLNRSPFIGFALAFTGTLPMLIGYFLFFQLIEKTNIESLFINTVSSSFFEELIFRAFLIGILYKYSRLGFIGSILLGSFLFAQVHLYQSKDTVEIIEIFTITFLGSILFSWIYMEWNLNLWTAIFVHLFMNLYWEIFNVSENVSGNLYGNLFKFTSILLIIFITIYYKKKKKIPFEITMKSLFLKSKETEQ